MFDEFGKDNLLNPYSSKELFERIEKVKRYIDTGEVFFNMDYIEETLQIRGKFYEQAQLIIENNEDSEAAVTKILTFINSNSPQPQSE